MYLVEIAVEPRNGRFHVIETVTDGDSSTSRDLGDYPTPEEANVAARQADIETGGRAIMRPALPSSLSRLISPT